MKNRIKKAVSLLLAVIMVACALPMAASAEEDDDFYDYENYTDGYYSYRLANGEAVINKYNNSGVVNLVIPSTINGYSVTGIDSYAVSRLSNLKSVTISENIGTIALQAFYDCPSLSEIKLPASLHKLSNDAFSKCPNIEKISIDSMNSTYYSKNNCIIEKDYGKLVLACKKSVLPNDGSIKTIGASAFSNCMSLAEIKLPEGVIDIESFAFRSGSEASLKNITFPSTLKKIGYAAFHSCERLQNVIFPDSLAQIDVDAFLNCISLNSVYIPESVTYLGENCLGYEFDEDGYEKLSGFTISGVTGSAAELYAKENGFKFIPHAHKYTEKILVPATCISNGKKLFTCSCGRNYEEEYAGSHNIVIDLAVNATCTAPGKTGGSHCSVCGAIISQPTIVPAKGHTLVTDPAVEPTCSTLGKTEGQHCSVCGTVTVEQKDIPMTAHTLVTDPAVEPTCSTLGKTEGQHCSVCGTVTVEQKDISMTKHKEKIEIKAATFASDGSEVKNCTVCGKTISNVKIVKIKSAALAKQTFTYSGKAISPTVIVNDQNGKVLKVGTDYNVAYKNNTLPGQASVIITFKGNYSGTKTLRFNILPGATSKISVKQNTNSIVATWSKVAGATGYNVYLFNGKKLVKKLAVTKTSATFKKLSSGTNYTVIVKSYTKSGSVTLSSAVSRKLNTATRPIAPSIVVKTNNNQAKVSWKKVAGANSYTVYYSLKKNGGFKKLSTAKNACVIKNLKPGKTYYFKAVANKKVNNKVITSPYSKIVTATIKK